MVCHRHRDHGGILQSRPGIASGGVPRRDRAYLALVILEVVGFFILVPLAATVRVPLVAAGLVVAGIIAAVLAIVWGNRLVTVVMLIAGGLEAFAFTLRVVGPSQRTETLDFVAALLLVSAVNVVLGVAVFGPGRVTVHRIVGAIAIYLNVAGVFALAYRVIAAFDPVAFAGKSVAPGDPSMANFVYFSFSTLTTSGYGDIVPVDAFARSAASLEAIVGQLFPATLLASLVTRELDHRRRNDVA